MNRSAVIKWASIFTLLSIGLGVGSAMSPAIANSGWAIGTLISTLGGILYGREASSRGGAAVGGALVGGPSIAIGCLLGFAMRALPIDGVIAATAVGVVTGCAGAFITHTLKARGRLSAS